MPTQSAARSTFFTWSCILVFGCAAGFAQTQHELSGEIFGTTYHVKVLDVEDVAELANAIRLRLNEIDMRMSTYKQDSELSLFNAFDGNGWFDVSQELLEVVELATTISTETDGAFDITVRPIVSLWNFGSEADEQFTLPTSKQIESTRARVGYQLIQTRRDPPSLLKTVPHVEIDLSAIAKGYAVDCVTELIRQRGVNQGMIEIGGEVRVLGKNSEGNPWRIGVESPLRAERRIGTIIPLDHRALATSGDYRNFFEHGGVFYSHTMDPRTGRPVEHRLASVSVVADSCVRADALATAILVMGPEAGFEFAVRSGIPALLVSRADDGFVRRATPEFPAMEVTSSDNQATTGTSWIPMMIASVIVFGVAILAMSVGTIVANRRLQGSCGGIAGLKDPQGRTMCDLCTKPSPECSGDPDANVECQT